MEARDEFVERLTARFVDAAPAVARLIVGIVLDCANAYQADKEAAGAVRVKRAYAADPQTAKERARERDRLKKAARRARASGDLTPTVVQTNGTQGPKTPGSFTPELSPILQTMGDKMGDNGGRAETMGDADFGAKTGFKTPFRSPKTKKES